MYSNLAPTPTQTLQILTLEMQPSKMGAVWLAEELMV